MKSLIEKNLKKETKYKLTCIINIIILLILNLTICLLTFMKQITINPLFIILNIIPIYFILLYFYKIINLKKENTEIYRNEIKNIIKDEIEIIEYEPKKYLNPSELYDLGIIPHYDNSYGSFLTTYSIDGNLYTFSNLKLDLNLSNPNMEYNCLENIFKGQIYILNYKTKINGQLRIITNTENYINIKYINNVKEKNYNEKVIKTESSVFNNIFNVYTTDEHYAFYVLTSKVIDKFIELQQKYGFYNMCILEDSIIIVQKSNKLIFDESIHKNTLKNFDKRKVIEELKEILNFIDTIENTFNA